MSKLANEIDGGRGANNRGRLPVGVGFWAVTWFAGVNEGPLLGLRPRWVDCVEKHPCPVTSLEL